MNDERTPTKLKLPLLGTLAFAIFCVGCGEKQDYSGSGDLEKAAAAKPASPPAGGGSVGATPAASVPQQERPAGP